MTEIVGMSDTFNNPNYHGDLFLRGPSDHPFLSATGGLQGGVKLVDSTLFSWSYYTLGDSEYTPRLEGATAPEASGESRAQEYNVLQVVHETVSTSYTRQNATGKYAADDVDSATGNQVTDEHAWQTGVKVKKIARGLNKAFLTGTFANPATNAEARRTRGILAAITSNVTGLTAGAVLTRDVFLDTAQGAWDNGGLTEDETRTIVVNSGVKRCLTKLFVNDAGYSESSRTVGGVHVNVIETDFGRFNIMLDRDVPADTLLIASLEQVRPVAMRDPRGPLFEEALAKTRSSFDSQIYGEWGLEYGDQNAHAKITGIDVAATLAA